MQNLKDIEAQILNNLRTHMHSINPKHSFRQVYDYSIFPPGKLFRPKLVIATLFDFKKNSSHDLDKFNSHSLLASAIEIHHSYTLIHDDLPCMDNDLTRRGRPTTHKKFNEWMALLAGDGLINGSYSLLSRINSKNSLKAIKIFSHLVGMKGLILGQVLDLSEEMSSDFKTLLKTHTLKTARLIQASIILSYLLIDEIKHDYRTIMNLSKLGHHLGISFQLLDDLSEIDKLELNSHEAKVNPFFNFESAALETLFNSLTTVEDNLSKYKLVNLRNVLLIYFEKTRRTLEKNRGHFKTHLPGADLTPIMGLLQRLSKI